MASPEKNAPHDIGSQVKDAMARDGWADVARILSECSRCDSDSIMTQLVSRDQWDAVKQVIRYVGDEERTWDIGDVLVKNNILLSVAEENWRGISKMPHERFLHSTLEWIVQRACTRAQQTDIVQYVLPHCADDQLDSVMTTLVERHMWQAVIEVLKRGVSDSVKRWAVEQTCQHCGKADSHYLHRILPHCADDQLDSVLTTLVERRLWWYLGEVLKRGVSDSVKRWAVAETCHHCDVSDQNSITYHILPHCADDQLDSVLTTLVERRLWQAVGEVLKRGVSDSDKRWAVEKACVASDQHIITKHIIPHCAGDQLESVLTTLVERRLWGAVEELLRRGVSDSLKRLAVEKALTYYENCILDHIFIGTYFSRLRMMNTYRSDDKSFVLILLNCTDDQLDSVLTALVERGLWRPVVEVLKRDVSDSVKRWAVEKACQHCYASDENFITQVILPHCADDQLDSVLTTLVGRQLWRAAEELLRRGVSEPVKGWAVKKALSYYKDRIAHDQSIAPIFFHCTDDQLDSVLTTLVERLQWEGVGEMLKRGVSDSVKRWAVLEACIYYEDHIYHLAHLDNILRHCDDDQLDYVLTTLVEQRRWLIVGHILKQIASDLKQPWNKHKTCRHCTLAEVYFSDCCAAVMSCMASKRPLDYAGDDLDLHQTAPTGSDVCTAVRLKSGREVSDAKRRANIKAALRYADEDSLINSILPYYVYDSMRSALTMLASRHFWSAFVALLHYCIIDTLHMWAFAKDTESTDDMFWDIVRNPCDGVKGLTPAMWRSVTWSGLQLSLKQLLDWDTPLCEVLCESLLAIVREIWLSGRESEIHIQKQNVLEEALSTVEHLHQQIKSFLMKCKTRCESDVLSCTQGVRYNYADRCCKKSLFLQLCLIQCLVQQYYKRKARTQMTEAILIVLTTVPVVPYVQSVALRVMLRHNRWDVIRHACLSGVCEQDRRQLFQAAVKQRQWSAVKRWADHTLYDDQRLWALGEARQEKRWDVYLKLADHGLSEWERVGVLFRVTMHADWKLVRHMLRTVADVTHMIELLTNTPGTWTKLGETQYKQRMNQLGSFEKTLMKDTHTLKTLKTMAKRGKWWVVLHNIRHKPNLQHARRALKAAEFSEAWHAVMQLVRLETDVTRRDSLFRDMVRLRQWAVCIELLEQGVSHALSLELRSEFSEQCQWTLVALVMECPMDDEIRKQIMHQAVMMREGSVVWECINNLQTRLSVEEREDMFQLAFKREVWQAVKPLIEEKDVTGIRHRDTALLEAIEQHQWDVVDHCQRHHADINMKDDDGHTPIHRAARKEDWEAVKELTVRDGDPNLLDREGLSVLHRAIRAKQWDAVKVLIQFHGDIHQPAQHRGYIYKSGIDTRTPLQMLIDTRQGELIESSLMWCPDQQKVVNNKEETVLHAVCLSGWPGALYHLIARKVDPLAVTYNGHTSLCYAVLCKDCPQRIVAECIKLGLSIYQPHITVSAAAWDSIYKLMCEMLKLPLALSVMRGLPVVTQMLCEAGEYSNRQFRELNIYLVQLTKANTDNGRDFRRAFSKAWKDVHDLKFNDPGYQFDTELVQQSADYLWKVSSTPRSLKSTCRLTISHCLTLSKTRPRDIAQLPLSSKMKDYLLFSDLTDPRYPDLSYRIKE